MELYQCSPQQKRSWFLQKDPVPQTDGCYVIFDSYYPIGPIREAIRGMHEKHEILRARIVSDDRMTFPLIGIEAGDEADAGAGGRAGAGADISVIRQRLSGKSLPQYVEEVFRNEMLTVPTFTRYVVIENGSGGSALPATWHSRWPL